MRRPAVIDPFFGDSVGEANDNMIAKKLKRSTKYINNDGFTIEIQGGAIHPTKNWVAWVDYYEKRPEKLGGWVDCNYFLRIKVNDKQVFEWTVETYNPYFGAMNCYMRWHDDLLVYIYREKHSFYGVTLSSQRLLQRIELGAGGTEFRIDGDVLSLMRAQDYHGFILQYQVPTWNELPPLSEDEARAKQIIE